MKGSFGHAILWFYLKSDFCYCFM